MSLDEYHADSAISSIKKLAAELKMARAEVAKARQDLTGEVMPLEPYPSFPSVRLCPSPEDAREKVEAIYSQCNEIRKKNLPAIENNKQVREKATAVMLGLGLREKVRRPKKRSRRGETEEGIADWLLDIRKQVPIADGWSNIETRKQDCLYTIDKWVEELEREKKARQLAEDRKQKTLEAERLAGAMASKYGLDPRDASLMDVMKAILDRNQILRLAHYLQLNRGDWSGGYDYAEMGLDDFRPATSDERAIAEEIQGLIDDWDGDGRCFRDCNWNYDRLFGLVKESDHELYADYVAVNEAMPAIAL